MLISACIKEDTIQWSTVPAVACGVCVAVLGVVGGVLLVVCGAAALVDI